LRGIGGKHVSVIELGCPAGDPIGHVSRHGQVRWSGGWRGVDASAKDAELISFRICQDDPACIALAEINWLSACCPESGHFVIPLAADRADVQVNPVGGPTAVLVWSVSSQALNPR
jgi:hypothetical protein